MEFSIDKITKYVAYMEACDKNTIANLKEGYILAKDIWINSKDLYTLLDDFCIMKPLMECITDWITEVSTDRMKFFIYSDGIHVSVVSADSVRELFGNDAEYINEYYRNAVFSHRYGYVKSITWCLNYDPSDEHGIVEFNGFFLYDEIIAFLKELNNALYNGIKK